MAKRKRKAPSAAQKAARAKFAAMVKKKSTKKGTTKRKGY